MASTIKIPSVGESVSEVTIGKWLKQEGEAVAKDEIVLALETDKVNVEVTAPEAGVLRGIKRQAGETAKIGEDVATIEVGAAAADSGANNAPVRPAKAEATSDSKQAPASAATVKPSSNGQADKPVVTPGPAAAAQGGKSVPMPAAARMLAEQGRSAEGLSGTGRGGRILKEDVQAAPAGRTAAAKPAGGAQAAPSAAARTEAGGSGQQGLEPGPTERVPMSPLRRKVAERLLAAQANAAILTTFNEVDMSAVMALRKTHQEAFVARNGIKLGFMSFFVKAAIEGLRAFPEINAKIDGQDIVYQRYYDIGVAVGTEKGLVVPVLKGAELIGFADIEKRIADFGARAKAGKLTLPEMSGGTFTITNGGVFGSLMSTPILNPPQSGILGMHSIVERPVGVAGKVELRPMMYIALSYDHRIVDGRGAVLFLKRIKECVESPERMLLDI